MGEHSDSNRTYSCTVRCHSSRASDKGKVLIPNTFCSAARTVASRCVVNRGRCSVTKFIIENVRSSATLVPTRGRRFAGGRLLEAGCESVLLRGDTDGRYWLAGWRDNLNTINARL